MTTVISPFFSTTAANGSSANHSFSGASNSLQAPGLSLIMSTFTKNANGSSVLGRLAASYHPLQGYVVANATQAAILAGAVAAAARAAPPPTAVSLPLVCLSSVLHGLVVTSAFVAASNAGGTGYVGLANQVGALLGSLFALVLVRAGAIPDAGGPTC